MRRLCALMSSVVLTFGLLIGPVGALVSQAASVSTPSVSPGYPIRGRAFVVSGRLSTKVARPVELQRHVGGKWRRVATATTAANGRYSFTTAAAASSWKIRVVAPRVKLGTKTNARIVSKSRSFRTVKVTPATPLVGAPFTVSESLGQKRARPVVLQRRTSAGWVQIGAGKSAKSGDFTISASLAATADLRVVAPRVKIAKKTYARRTLRTFRVTTITPATLRVTTASLPDAEVGTAYIATLAGTGGISPYAWAATGLPAGLSLAAATGKISGTPTTATAGASITGTLTDARGKTATSSFTLEVNPAVSITTTELPGLVVGTAYSTTLVAAGGTAPYTWEVTGLPSGLSYHASTGVITGTPATATWTTAAVTVRDANEKTSATSFALTPLLQGIAAGNSHSCAIAGGSVWCWGSNEYGQGGSSGFYNLTPAPVTGLGSGVSAISAGASHTCAIVNGAAKCWGRNQKGQLGNSSHVNANSPVTVTGLGSGVTAISAGANHTCAIVNGAAMCWGDNLYGQGGIGSHDDTWGPAPVTGLGSGVTSIAAGVDHSCAIANLTPRCWGRNQDGQLGNNNFIDTTVPVAVSTVYQGPATITAGSNHTCWNLSGQVLCWGADSDGQLGIGGGFVDQPAPWALGSLDTGVTAIDATSRHTCVVDDGAIKCWGYNWYGQVGDGTAANNQVSPVAVVGLGGGGAAVAAGNFHSCAIVGGAARCWGRNDAGQLGDATYDDSPIPRPVVWPVS